MAYVIKYNGEKEQYQEYKLRRSLEKADADYEVIEEILKKVRKKLYNGITTKELYEFVLNELKKQKETVACCKYNYKQAILDLGKEGFAFEKFVGQLFEAKGYSIKLNQNVKGKNISHEIDVSAKKGSENLMIECKHHMQPWFASDIKTALYVYARFLDVKDHYTQPVLVTNTKFTPPVIKYSEGVGLKLMGWGYPKEENLHHETEKYGLHPITLINAIDKHTLDIAFDKGIVTVKDLLEEKPAVLSKKLHLPKNKVAQILNIAEKL